MAEMEDNSIDSIICDPPYEIGFMNRGWDSNGIAYDQEVWRQAWRVLKPGGYILAFGGSRTYHRLACAIEDAGFEIRDCISWVYGSGFPKSLDVSKAIDRAAGAEREVIGQSEVWENNATGGRGGQYANGPALPADGSRKTVDITATDAARQWDGWGTALKPAHEPIVMARKPLSEKTVAANVLRWGCGAVNIDASRIGTEDTISPSGETVTTNCHQGYQRPNASMFNTGKPKERSGPANPSGRWPANLILGHAPGCVRRGEKKVRGVQKAAGSPGFGSDRDDNYELGTGREYGPEETVADWWCAEGCPVRMIGEQSGHLKSGKVKPYKNNGGWKQTSDFKTGSFEASEGTAARFFFQVDPDPLFYCAKASRSERNRGLEGMPLCPPPGSKRSTPAPGRKSALGNPRQNGHPTVKPLKLMRYLVRLVTPPGGTVLDPFAGSGTTLVAAKEEGFNFIGIELEPEYIEIAEARLAAAERPPATLEDFAP
jgi:site-specific DNA-methyltransferase (adenine-specific)